MAKNKQWYVTRKPSAEYVMYDFARSAAQAKDMLRDLSEGSPIAHRSKSEGGLYNIYVKKGSVYSREKGGGVDYFTRKDGSKISKDEWYKGMEDKLGFEKFAERILKDSQFGRTTSMPKNEFIHNRNIARATIEDDFVFIDHSPKGIKENQSGEMVHTFTDLRKLTEFLQREKIYAHGGKMKQGYNDRMDDSLGNRTGKASSKEQDYKDRRDEAKAMNKAEGKRAYQSVGTMDKMADGGKVDRIYEMVANSIFIFNSKGDKVNTEFGSKTRIGLANMIANDNYSSNEVANAIFDSNEKNGKIKTSLGDKTLKGLVEVIDRVRSEKMASGGLVFIDTEYDLESAEKRVEKLKKSGDYRRVQKRKNVYPTHTATGKRSKRGSAGTFYRIFAQPIDKERKSLEALKKKYKLEDGGGIDGQTFRSAVLWAQGDIEENYNYEDSDLNIQHDLMSDHTELYKAANKFGIQDEGDWREIYEVAFEEMGIENPPQFKKGGKTDDWIQGVEAEMKKKGTVGAFTKQAKRAGMTVKEFTKEVLDNPDKYSKRTRERAQFAKNVSKYESGGLFDSEGRKYSKKKGAFLTSEWFTGDLDFLNY